MKKINDLIGGILGCLLIACGSTPPVAEKPAAPTPASRAAPAPRPVVASPAAAPQDPPREISVRSRLLGNRNLQMTQSRPLNVRQRCDFVNETGYKGTADVEVKDGVVQKLRVDILVPDPAPGRCAFDMTGMTQTQATPTVELVNKGNGCTARMWEQGDKVTLSFTQCERACSSRETFKYVWPVLITRSTGHCD